MEFAIGSAWVAAAVVVAIVLFGLGWWMVSHARAGNAKVREARHDPHLDVTEHGDEHDPQRNIPQ